MSKASVPQPRYEWRGLHVDVSRHFFQPGVRGQWVMHIRTEKKLHEMAFLRAEALAERCRVARTPGGENAAE